MTNNIGNHESNVNVTSGMTLDDAMYGDVGFSGVEWQGTDYLDDGLSSGALTDDYKSLVAYDGQAGIMKIEPVSLKQGFTYWTTAYINEGLSYPQIQRVPVTNINIKPHQISFDFFDTTEGKIGVSNATEKHMEVEGDIYVTELIYYYWDHYQDSKSGKTGDHTTGLRAGAKTRKMIDSIISGIREDGKTNLEIDKTIDRSANGQHRNSSLDNSDSRLSFTGADKYSNLGIDFITPNFEETQAFIDFRNTFLMTFTGWVCKFTSQTFGTFYGVFTDISYQIDDGYSDAKWHFKIEEAVFTEDYNAEKNNGGDTGAGTNPPNVSQDSSTTDSGDVSNDK